MFLKCLFIFFPEMRNAINIKFTNLKRKNPKYSLNLIEITHRYFVDIRTYMFIYYIICSKLLLNFKYSEKSYFTTF